MNPSFIVNTLVFSIPEGIVIVWLLFSMLGDKVLFRYSTLCGVTVGALASILRLISGNYVNNVLLYLSTLFIVVMLFTRKNWIEKLIASVLAFSLYLVIEFINIKIVESVFKINPALMNQDIFLKGRFFAQQIVVVVVISILLKKFGFSLFKKNDWL